MRNPFTASAAITVATSSLSVEDVLEWLVTEAN